MAGKNGIFGSKKPRSDRLLGGHDVEQPMVGPKGERAGAIESN